MATPSGTASPGSMLPVCRFLGAVADFRWAEVTRFSSCATWTSTLVTHVRGGSSIAYDIKLASLNPALIGQGCVSDFWTGELRGRFPVEALRGRVAGCVCVHYRTLIDARPHARGRHAPNR